MLSGIYVSAVHKCLLEYMQSPIAHMYTHEKKTIQVDAHLKTQCHTDILHIGLHDIIV